MPKDDQPEKSVVILACPGVTMLDLVGTHSMLGGLGMAKYKSFIVAPDKSPVQSDTPLKIVPDKSFAELSNPTILVVVGGGLGWLRALGDATRLEYVSRVALVAERLISTGTGSLLLAAAGLLKDRTATTHWVYSGLLEALGARYMRQRWVEEGKIVTCAAGTGGMDYGLKLVSQLAGESNARMLQLMAEYDPQPPFGAVDWQAKNGRDPFPLPQAEMDGVRKALAGQPGVFQAFETWIGEKEPV